MNTKYHLRVVNYSYDGNKGAAKRGYALRLNKTTKSWYQIFVNFLTNVSKDFNKC